jgi:ADP-heptose:LPS heptosyltransferase
MATSLDMIFARRVDQWVGLLICAPLFCYSRLRARLGGPAQPPLRATTPPDPGALPLRPQRILAIKTYGLGNLAMILPALGVLRRGLPDAEIDFLTLDENRPLLERSGVVSRVIGLKFDGYVGLIRSFRQVLRALRGRRYDLVIDFEQFIKLSAILSFLTGAPHRIGFNTDRQRRGWLYTTRIVYRDSEHMSRIFMRLLRPLEIDMAQAPVSIETKPEEEAQVVRLLSELGVDVSHQAVVAVHVGCGPNFYKVALKRWPTDHFTRLCDELIARFDVAVVFTGKGPEEEMLIRDTMAGMELPAVNACDQLSLGELFALLRRCRLVISNDTSVSHFAALVNAPVVSFFGSTDPLQYGPGEPGRVEGITFYKELHCSPCLTNYNLKLSSCSDPVCMRRISPEEVMEAIAARYFPGNASADLHPGA